MAGLLGDIFSTVDTAKRKLTDLLGNPVLSAQQIIGNMNDRARVLNQLTAGAAQERDIYGPKSQQLANMIADAYNPMGMMVYHGSPAKFSRFDPTKIGSGEGAQAYGYGHYVAQNPAVAKEYRTVLSEPELFVKGRQIKTAAGSNMDTAKAWLQDSFEMGAKNPYADAIKKVSNAPLKDKQGVIDALRKLENRGVQMQKGGFEYEIDLPDEQIAKMLDWDKPLSKQKDVMAALNNVAENNVKAKVRNEIENQIRTSGVLPVDQTGDDYMSLLFGQSEETIAKANQMLKQLADEQMAKIDFAPLVKSELEGMKPPTMTWDATGKEFYEMLAQRRGSPEAASALFREQGIPGIRYLDEGSRGRGEGTSNFVVFPGNEDLLTILKRNGGLLGP